ncbi:metallophosphoesterase [Bacillus marinisedimentorum]|uniref:metallophosphoesterase n=1 Tax=Bacillus marinisedimentorum TaxID=1821260 RepID=UPI00087219C3|nr:metallophosphoesterase [Bacillus marinisedimentorum]
MTGFLLSISVLFLYKKANANTKKFAVNTIHLDDHDQNRDVSAPSVNILHLSDLHLENLSVTPDDLYEKFKDESFDLIALTGDFLDRKRSIPKLVPYLEALNRLDAKYGMYAVFGNHDYVLRENNFSQLKELLNAHGCRTMQNESATITVDGCPLHIIGVDDYSTGRSNLKQAFREAGDGFRLVLTHDPNVVLDMEDYHYDYLLSGHFHGGQIHWPKPYHLVKMGKLVRMEMIKGLNHYNGKRFYISEGLGQTGVNIRVGSRPETTCHRFSLSGFTGDTETKETAL